ncbi:MAG TPA: LPXTG cell wall anchor domain-containing protein, partial [Roseiflexaceae bacterium]|nr:LPXTG cell wall anchor domain-containing protein [Roseiflexaceae bacterium]
AYYCEYHGTKNGQGMYGKLIVTASAAQPADVAAALPRTGGREFAMLGVLLALVLGGAGVALRRRGQSRAP